MTNKVRIFQHMFVDRKLSRFELHGLCGALVHHSRIDEPVPASKFVKPVPEKRFRLRKIPQEPVIKLAKTCHVEDFFDTGRLQLGSFEYYNAYDHSEIGDANEGVVTLLAKTPFGVQGGKYGGGYNNRVFCTFVGEVDSVVLKKFGYDSGILITQPDEFARSIANSIGARDFTYGRCLYRKHKAVLGFPGREVERGQLSARCVEIVKSGKYFIKNDRYAHQKEFRFLWEMEDDVADASIFDCRAARQFCRPLEI